MRKYLATLHKKSDDHKKYFALAVSGGFTLFIFTFWMLANFGNGGILARNDESTSTEDSSTVMEGSPLQSMSSSIAASWQAIRDNFDDFKKGLNGCDIKGSYEEMRDNTLDTYGR